MPPRLVDLNRLWPRAGRRKDVGTFIQGLVDYVQEIGTDTGTQGTFNAAVDLLLEELHDDHAILVTLLAELIADHATSRTADLSYQNAIKSGVLSSPGLRIDGGSASAIAEAELAFRAIVNGTIVLVAAGTNMPALTGTVNNTEFGLFLWSMQSDGTVTQATLATGATLGAITVPAIPTNEVCIGALIVNPTGTGNFVGGTTNIDDATVAPNPVFLQASAFGFGINPAAAAPPATLTAPNIATITAPKAGAGPAALTATAPADLG